MKSKTATQAVKEISSLGKQSESNGKLAIIAILAIVLLVVVAGVIVTQNGQQNANTAQIDQSAQQQTSSGSNTNQNTLNLSF